MKRAFTNLVVWTFWLAACTSQAPVESHSTVKDDPRSPYASRAPGSVGRTYIMANLSNAAYITDEAQRIQAFRREGFTRVTPVYGNGGQTAAFVLANHDSIVTVYRGTDNLSNVGTDLHAIDVPGTTTRVNGLLQGGSGSHWHPGFAGTTLEMQTEVEQAIELERRNIASRRGESFVPNIGFTGHSLGGAQATLASAISSQHQVIGAARPEVYTFGAPGVGNVTAQDRVSQIVGRDHIFAYGNPLDPVPVSTGTWATPWIARNQFEVSTGRASTLTASDPLLANHRMQGYVDRFRDIRTFSSTSDDQPATEAISAHGVHERSAAEIERQNNALATRLGNLGVRPDSTATGQQIPNLFQDVPQTTVTPVRLPPIDNSPAPHLDSSLDEPAPGTTATPDPSGIPDPTVTPDPTVAPDPGHVQPTDPLFAIEPDPAGAHEQGGGASATEVMTTTDPYEGQYFPEVVSADTPADQQLYHAGLQASAGDLDW